MRNKIGYVMAAGLGLLMAVNSFSAINLVPTKAEVATFLRTNVTNLKSKLVFVSGKGVSNFYLNYVDFSEATPTIRQMTNTKGAIYPVISPDGNWVVFGRGVGAEQQPGKCSTFVCQIASGAVPVFVADSAYQPRFKLNSSVMTVIYSSKDIGAANWLGGGKVYSKAVPNGVPAATATVLFSGGSYYGGLSWDNNYLCTGQDRGVMVDLQNSVIDTIHQLMMKAGSATPVLSLYQVCNSSISSSRKFTNAMMYVDFGVAQGFSSPIIGSWAFHGRIFISNINNQILKYFNVPAAEAIFDASADNGTKSGASFYNPEWSNHPYYAVSAIQVNRAYPPDWTQNPTNNCEAVYALNLKDSAYLKLLTTTDTAQTSTTNMGWPWLWIDTTGLSESSTWLSHVKVDDRAVPVLPGSIRSAKNVKNSLSLNGTVVTASVLLQKVSVYDLSGKLVSEISLSQPDYGVDISIFRRQSGVFMIRAVTVDGKSLSLENVQINK